MSSCQRDRLANESTEERDKRLDEQRLIKGKQNHHAYTVVTRPFLLHREGPGDEATPFHVQCMRTLWFWRHNGTCVNHFAHIAHKLRLAPLYALHDTSSYMYDIYYTEDL